MPSLIVGNISGGVFLMSGDVFSGTAVWHRAGGLTIKVAAGAPGIIGVGLPDLSGTVNTFSSGLWTTSGVSGALSIGQADAMELSPGGTYTIPKYRLTSGVMTPRLLCPAASSGGRAHWEWT